MKNTVAMLAACFALAAAATAEDFVKGRILVKFKDGMSEAQVSLAIEKAKGKVSKSFSALGIKVIELPANANEKAQANAFRQRPDVEYAEPDYLYTSAYTPNDIGFGSQWHLSRISAPGAWDLTKGGSVIVAVLDSGVSGWHEDLASQMVPGWNFVNGNSDTSDVNGHGSMVAGVAAASADNFAGISGVGFNCKIMPLRISDASGMASASNMAAALQWAADHGAKVANVSFPASNSATVRSAAQYFMNKGGVVAMSSGNTGTFDSNADNPYVLTVSATNSSDAIAGFSTVGNFIDCAAPGEGIYTTSSGGGYTWGSGTSFSAPVVAGVAALMFSANPNLSGAQCYELLRKSGDDLGAAGWDPNYGWGRVNALKAVQAAQNTVGQDITPPSVSFSTPGNKALVSGVVSVFTVASDNNAVDRVLFYVNDTLVGTKFAAPYAWTWDTTSLPDGNYTLMAKAYDLAGNMGQSSIGVSVSKPDSVAPEARITSPGSGTTVGAKLTVQVSASDNKAVTKVDLFLDGSLVGSDTRAGYSFSLNTKSWAKGSHSLQAKAYDAAGNVGVSTVVIVNK